MICTRCNRQMPDDSTVCPHCGQPVVPPEQIMKEIKVRRLQRYLFYAVVVLIVIAAVAIMVRIYNNNTKLVLEISQVKQSLEGAQGELTAAQSELEQKKQDLAKVQAELAESCLLYTSDAADDLLCVDLGGRRIIKKKTLKVESKIVITLKSNNTIVSYITLTQ